MRRWSSSFTRRRWFTTTSSTTRSCGADAWRCTRGGATTSRCSSATTCTSSRWRWRSRTTRSTSCALLCDVTLRMIEGELYQLTKNGDADITEDEHFDIIRRKTAYLFGGCAQIGGMLGRVSPEQEQALQEYGFNLGIAFQIVDDLLDFTGDLTALGKPVGADLREGKMTLPLIHLLQQGEDTGGEDRPRHHRVAHRQRRAVDRAPRACSRNIARSSTPHAAPSSTPSARRNRSTSSRPARSAMRCWRCPTTCFRETGETAGRPHPRTARGDSSPRRALLHPQRPRDFRRGVRSAAARARTARGRRIRISSRPIRRHSAWPGVPSKDFRPSSIWFRCSASTTPTTARSCSPSTSASARAPASATEPVVYVAELKIDGLSLALTYENGCWYAARPAATAVAART